MDENIYLKNNSFFHTKINLEEQKKQSILYKRTFDLLFSIFSILVSSPIMLMVAILIKVKSPEGNILFKQKRLGLNGQEFEVYKFRTMIPDAEKKLQELLERDEEIRREYLTYRKLKNDIRIIKGIGHFLRKTSLDELPQFFNILFGHMSVVGPRPYIKDEFYQHSDSIVQKVTSVKPGITGFWQVVPTRHDTTFDERVRLDIEYINKRRFMLDLKIVMKTVAVMVLRRGV